MQTDKMFWPQVMKHSNLTKDCPIVKVNGVSDDIEASFCFVKIEVMNQTILRVITTLISQTLCYLIDSVLHFRVGTT